MVGWRCFLLVLGSIGLQAEDSKGHLLDIYSPVKANASSSFTAGRVNFAPQLAIQADTSNVLDNCFISKEQVNPWYRLEFKSVTSVFNVRLGVRKDAGENLPRRFNLKKMNGLSVYVSNSSNSLALGREIEQRCGSPWKYTPINSITFSCERILKGRYVHVIVSSTSPTYLLICSIVINREDGPVTPLDFSEVSATVTSSGSKSDQPPNYAIDGTVSSCSSLSGMGKTWLRVDLRIVRYITKVRSLFDEGSKTRTTISIGRSLQNNGANGNLVCDKVGRILRKSWVNFTCETPILGQFIYIERRYTSMMKICEIEIFYDTILNIYSPVIIAASGQRYENSSIWKPIDGVRGGAFEASWISLKSTKSWWRMEFPQRNVISSVIINTPFLGIERRRETLASVVYIGDFSDGDGSSNTKCNGIWTYEDIIQAINCSGTPAGKYFVIASTSAENVLYLNEITLYGCEEPEVMITTAVSEQTQRPKSVNLTCHGTNNGCNVTKVIWTGWDGKPITSASEGVLDGKNASTIVVSNDSLHLPYTCTLEYAGKSVARSYTERPTGTSNSVPSAPVTVPYPSITSEPVPTDSAQRPIGSSSSVPSSPLTGLHPSIASEPVPTGKTPRPTRSSLSVPSAPVTGSYPSITSEPVPTARPTRSSSSVPCTPVTGPHSSITSEPVPTGKTQGLTGTSSSVPSSPVTVPYPSITSEPVSTGSTQRPIGSSSSVPSTPLTGPHPSIAREPVPTARPTKSSSSEAPERVRNVLLTPLSSNEINVNWAEPINSKGKISLYEIYYSVVKDDTSRKRVKVNGTVDVLGNVTSTIVRDLNKYTLYYVTVTAITVTDGVRTSGEMSSPVTVMTLEDAPSAPVNVSVTSIINKPQQLLVTWRRPLFPNGVIREYNVNYRKSGYGPHLRGVLVVPGTSETAVVDELEAYTEYSVYIQAYTNKGGDLSSIAIGKTDEGKPSVPTNFTSMYITHNSTLLKWNSPRYPRGRITKYEIQYIGKKSFMEDGRQQEDSRNNTVILKHLNELQMALHDLIPDTTFTFTVVAFTRNGPGEKAVIRSKTHIDWPIRPKMSLPQGKLRRTVSGVQVELVQPSNRHGTITHVDFLLAKVISGPGIFHIETPVSYTTSLPGNVVYITARFKFEEVPTTFVIGDGKSYGGYFNGPLEGGFAYSYALRSYSVSVSKQVLFSTSPNIYFSFESENADCKPTDGTGTTVVICVVAVVGTAIVSVLVIVAVRLRQRRGTVNPNVNKSTSDPGNEIEAEKSERSKDKKSLEHSMTASSLYAQSSVSSAVKDAQSSILEPEGSAPDHLYESLEMTVMTSSLPSEVTADKSNDGGNESSITYEATTDVDAQ